MSKGKRINVYLNEDEKKKFVNFMQKMNLGNTLDGGNKSKAVKAAIDLAFAKLKDIDELLESMDERTKELYLKTFDPINKK